MNTSQSTYACAHRIHALLLLAALLPAVASATCSPNCPPPPSVWMMEGANESNSNYNPNETVLDYFSVQTPGLKVNYYYGLTGFNQKIYFPYIFGLVASSDTIYANLYTDGITGLTHQGSVKALDASAGALRWQRTLSSFGAPDTFTVTSGAHVYVDDSNSQGIWSVDPLTGAQVGAGNGYLTASGTDMVALHGGPKIYAAALYYARQDGGLRAVSTSGTQLWQIAPTAQQTYLNPLALGAGRVFALRVTNLGSVNTQANALVALDAKTGAVAWSHSFASDTFMNRPSYSNGSVYIKGRSIANVNTVYRLDAATGAVLATFSTSSFQIVGQAANQLASVEQPLSVGAGVVLVEGVTGDAMNPYSMIALDQLTMQKKWEAPLNGTAVNGWYGAPSIATDFAIACIGVIRVWHLTNGASALPNAGSQTCSSQPIIAGGRYIFGENSTRTLKAYGY